MKIREHFDVWVDCVGNIIDVPFQGHRQFALQTLANQGVDLDFFANPINALMDNGWIPIRHLVDDSDPDALENNEAKELNIDLRYNQILQTVGDNSFICGRQGFL